MKTAENMDNSAIHDTMAMEFELLVFRQVHFDDWR
jgi:hypothetical protein